MRSLRDAVSANDVGLDRSRGSRIRPVVTEFIALAPEQSLSDLNR